jgi:hypothetical protein
MLLFFFSFFSRRQKSLLLQHSPQCIRLDLLSYLRVPERANCQVPDDYKAYGETTQVAWHAIVSSHGLVALH